MRHVWIPFLLLSLISCTRDRAVEAPVVDVAVGTVDAGGPRPYTANEPIESEPAVPPGDTSGMIGRWEGVGVQDDGQSWEIVVTVTSLRGACATADYPTVPCKGQWICTSESHGVVTAREKLQGDSASRCIDNGTMTWRLQRDVLDWTWSGQGQTARAQLHRTR